MSTPPMTISSSRPRWSSTGSLAAGSEKVSSLSVNSWKRHHADKVVELSPRRRGVRLRDALMIRRSP